MKEILNYLKLKYNLRPLAVRQLSRLIHRYNITKNKNLYIDEMKKLIKYEQENNKVEVGITLEDIDYDPIGNDRYIYFIQSENNGYIKIGISINPKKRIKTLQSSSPYKLKILKVIRGNYRDEKKIHQLFELEKINGEWFKPSERLLEYIKYLDKK